MKDYILKRPMLLSGIFCSIVAVLGYYFKISLLFSAVISVIALFIMILKEIKLSYIIAVIMVMIVIISSFFAHGNADTLRDYNEKSDICSFTVTDVTYKSSGFCSADVEILESKILEKGTRLSAYYSSDELKIGDIVKGELKLKNINGSDYRNLYYSKGIYLTASLKKFEIYTDRGDAVLKIIGSIRDYIRKTLFANLRYSNASTVAALVLGDDSYFTADFNYNIKAAGVSHIMVVSGMHLSLLVLLVTYFVEKLVYSRYLRAIIMFLTVVFIIAVCGFTATMLRAGITYYLMAFALLLNRKSTPDNTLGAAVTVILAAFPFTILSVGFLLSVLATFGILAVALPIIEYIRCRKLIADKFLFSVISALVITLSATILTLPVLIHTFGIISTVSLISNLLITFMTDIVLWLSVIALALGPILPMLSKAVFFICEPLVECVNLTINFFGSLPFSVLRVPQYLSFAVIAVIILMFYVMLACKKRIDMVKLKEIRKKIISEGGKPKNGGSF